MPEWDEFSDLENLKLAWRRVLRSVHHVNKDRIGLRVYSANIEANLENLQNRLNEGLYEPTISENIYLPKRQGTVRRISVLTIEDRLVYQAITNLITRKTKSDFEARTNGHVFAHLAADLDSPFMLRRWAGSDGQYQRFLGRFKQLWMKGNHWLLESDIASYYDSIDHELLGNELSNRWGLDDQLLNLLLKCLRTWAAQEKGSEFSRGLPQGYEASDYLATLFLLPADEQMIQSAQFQYLRYVDDIRILASNQDDARQSLIQFDLALKKQALILQPDKSGFRKVTDIDEEIDNLANVVSMIEIGRRFGQKMDRESEDLFLKSWHNLENDKRAESRLVFALNRIPTSRPSRDIALQMLRMMPWRSSAVLGYLGKFRSDDVVIKNLISEINNHKVYAWHISNCITALSKISLVSEYYGIYRKFIVDDRLRWYQRLAAVEALQHDQDGYGFLFSNYSKESNYLVRGAMLVAAAFTASMDEQIAAAIRSGLKDSHPQIQAIAVWLFLEFPNCGVDEDEFGPEVGIHRKMIPKFSELVSPGACYIKAKLTEFFGLTISEDLDFHRVFPSNSYGEAIVHLQRAFRYYSTDPSVCITAIDNFNHIICIAIIEKIEKRPIPRDEYANMLGALKANHGSIAVHFSECHELRCRSRGAHPWASSLSSWAQDVTHPQKEKLMPKLKVAYQDFIDVFADKFT